MDRTLGDMTRIELAAAADAATAIVPLGSTEQHGPHLPAGTDTIIVTELTRRAAQLAGDHVEVVVLPTLPFGVAGHHLPFGATISLRAGDYIDALSSVGTSLATSGFRRVLFVNGHGGNDAAMRVACDRLVYEECLPAQVGGVSYWECARGELAAMPDLHPVPGHAGNFETSCLLALRPDLVRLDSRPRPESELQPLATWQLDDGTVRRPDVWQLSDGRTDDSGRASVENGQLAVTAIVDALTRFIVNFHESATRTQFLANRPTLR